MSVAFDREKEEPVIKKSICTGEATVGFVDKNTGHYRDIRKVNSPIEIEAFCEEVGIDPQTIRTIY
ncbi:MAG: aspartate dehydrogenase [Clostridiales bacterium]|nr:aspartate dehydrogenase [Clostridiales bacterium]